MRRVALLSAAVLVLALRRLRERPNANPRDPFEPFNRKMMQFNEGVDAVALKPVATFYREVVPAAGAHRRAQLLQQPERRLVGRQQRCCS